MLIVDAQIHLWEKGAPSARHRRGPYSAQQAVVAWITPAWIAR